MLLLKMYPQIKATAFFHLIEWIMFFILLVTAGFLAQQVLHEYQEGKTNFGISSKPLTVHDVPTLTICFIGARKIAYGEDLLITAFEHYTENTRQLKEGKNDHHSHNITLDICHCDLKLGTNPSQPGAPGGGHRILYI